MLCGRRWSGIGAASDVSQVSAGSLRIPLTPPIDAMLPAMPSTQGGAMEIAAPRHVGCRVSCGAVVLLTALAVFGVVAPSASADHFSGEDSVDGGEIRYEDYTKYDGARTRTIDAWNALGSINICPDDAWHICDLEVDDVDRPDNPAYGWWYGRDGADALKMNTATLDPITPDSKRTDYIRHVMAHEFGHSLGIGTTLIPSGTTTPWNTPTRVHRASTSSIRWRTTGWTTMRCGDVDRSSRSRPTCRVPSRRSSR